MIKLEDIKEERCKMCPPSFLCSMCFPRMDAGLTVKDVEPEDPE